jgi:hypothetical protein
MFEKAARLKLRFPYKGQITVEDLWDLSPEHLDSIFKTLNVRHKAAQEESLLTTRTTADLEVKLQIDIIKHVVQVKLEEAEQRKSAADRRAKKQKLMEIIASKQDTELQGKSVEDLQRMVSELD